MKTSNPAPLLRRSPAAAALLAALWASGSARAHDTYQLHHLGYGNSDVRSIGNSGRIAANQWSSYGMLVDGSIAVWSQANAFIHDFDPSGQAVGGTYPDAFLLSAAGLHTLGSASLPAISDGGTAVGYRWSSGPSEAIEWDGSGAPTVLSAPGWTDAQAQGISPDGRYVVGRAFTGNAGVAMRWDRQLGTTQPLPTVVPLVGGGLHGGSWAEATAVNDAGTVVGTIDGHAVRWTASSGFAAEHLGPRSGTSTCRPTAINAHGLVVGECDIFNEAFLWSPGDTALTSLVDVVDPASSAGWILNGAYDINDLGQIVGLGYGPLGYEGFVLSPEGACLVPCTFADGTTLDLPINQCGGLGGTQPPWAAAVVCHEPEPSETVAIDPTALGLDWP